jgi:hypothetical protein
LSELSYRQMKRVWARFSAGGAQAVQHRSCGQRSNRGYNEAGRDQVVRRYGERYGDFGPTLAAELDEVFWLEEECVVSADWVAGYKTGLLQLKPRSRHYAPAAADAGDVGSRLGGGPHSSIPGDALQTTNASAVKATA